MTFDEKKAQMQRFMLDLEKYAIESGSKKRILDTISELKEELSGAQSEEAFQRSQKGVDDLLAYMMKQNADAQNVAIPEDAVSMEEIRQRLRDSMQKCRNTNAALEESYRADCQSYIQEAGRNMQDYTKVEANYEDIVNESRFCNVFSQIGQKYAGQVNEQITRYADEACENYCNMMGGIRRMLSVLPEEQRLVSQKDFFQRWDKNQDMVRAGCREQIGSMSGGEEEIVNFGQENVHEVSKIIKRQNAKKMHIKMIPLYVVLVLALVLIGGHIIRDKIASDSQPVAEEQSVEAEEQSFGEKILGNIEDVAAEKISNSVVEKVGGAVAGGSIMSFLAAVLTIVLFGWWFFMRQTEKRSRKWICSAVGTYLAEALKNTSIEGVLHEKTVAKFQTLSGFINSRYEALAEDILGVFFDEKPEEEGTAVLDGLAAEWKRIKAER